MTYNLKSALDNPLLAIPSRPTRWIQEESPGIFPVSCTMLALQNDTFDADSGTSDYETLSGSLEFTARVLKGNAGSTIDLSEYTATHPASKGELSLMLDADHPDILEFIEADFGDTVKIIYFDNESPNHKDYLTVTNAIKKSSDLYWTGEWDLEELDPTDKAHEFYDEWLFVEDTCYDSEGSIFGTLRETMRYLYEDSSLWVDFSDLRPKGTKNGYGMEASGPVSFMHLYAHLYAIMRKDWDIVDFMPIYSSINQCIRKGNTFKNGAVSVYVDILKHPAAKRFMELPSSKMPWAKRAVYLTEELLEDQYADLLETLLQKSKEGLIWWAKYRYDEDGNRLFSNTCLETHIPSRATCNIAGVNLGQIRPWDFVELNKAFKEGMTFLCELHKQSELAGDVFLERKDDMQVLLHVIGLSNMLASWGVKYQELVTSFYCYEHDLADPSQSGLLVHGLYEAYDKAAEVARSYGMKRGFGIAPTESVSYRHQDLDGFTCTPEISPPLANPITHKVRRDSISDSTEYQYPLNGEVAFHDVKFHTYFDLACSWQRMMDSTGLAHSISFNQWNPGCDFSKEYFKLWLMSPLWTTYYTLLVDQSAQDKTSIGLETGTGEHWVVEGGEGSVNPFLKPELESPLRKEGCSVCAGG